MTRWQQILSGLLVLQLAATAVVYWPKNNAESVGGPLFPELDPADVVSITLENGEGSQLLLARQDGGWVLPEAGGFPAQADRIEPVLAKIAELQTTRLVAQTAASHGRLKVADDDFEGRVRLELADGRTQTFFVGASPNFRSVHLRRAGVDDTYLVDNLTRQEFSADLANWIDTLYFQVDRDSVAALTLENGNGRFELQKDAEGNWTLAGLEEGELFNEAPLNSILARLSNMRLARPLGTEAKPEYGLDNPQATVTVVTTTEDGAEETFTLLVGAQDPETNNYVVKWSASDYYVQVATFSGDEMVQSTRADFAQRPTPVPADGVTPTPGP